MPKQKAHRGTAKRIKVSATGKLIRRRENGNHFLEKKSGGRKRHIVTPATVVGGSSRNIKRALGA